MCTWEMLRVQNREVLCPSRCFERSIDHPPPCLRLSVWPRRSLRMQPARSGGMRDSSERAAASRRALRFSLQASRSARRRTAWSSLRPSPSARPPTRLEPPAHPLFIHLLGLRRLFRLRPEVDQLRQRVELHVQDLSCWLKIGVGVGGDRDEAVQIVGASC